jgi:hypothetical protein
MKRSRQQKQALGEMLQIRTSEADVAGHILALAEDNGPWPVAHPVLTSGAGRRSRPARTGDRNLSTRQVPADR